MRGRVDGAAARRDGATAPDAAGQQDGAPGSAGRTAGGFGMGGPGGEQVNTQLADMVTSAGTRWAAATMGSQGAATLELRTGTAVMAIGGFIGSDPSPTLEQFQAYVANGEIHYFIAGGMGGGPGRGNSEISQWVQQHFTAQTVGQPDGLRPHPAGELTARPGAHAARLSTRAAPAAAVVARIQPATTSPLLIHCEAPVSRQ